MTGSSRSVLRWQARRERGGGDMPPRLVPLGAASLASAANRGPRRVVLFHATDDDVAATTAERLILAAGFQPLKAGGVAAAVRIETPGGDLHQYEMNGELLGLDQARALLNAKEVLT
jgi:8-hydroxy-5-deazaflavin:NADPH oxidoreductase